MKTLQDKIAIVTGSATETGQAVALELARAGAAVCVCGPVEETNERIAALITQQGGRALPITVDLSREEDVARLVQQTLQAFERVDVLVLISAVWGGGAIHEHAVQVWDRVMALNLRAPFLLTRAVLPHMREQGNGHIINIGSESGLQTYDHDGAYGISLHALNALMAEIQVENEAAGVRVDNLCTGLVVSAGSPEGLYAQDVAEWVLWLATRRAGLVSPAPILVRSQQTLKPA
jgi:NAD(P)-dependent dehydrogenase (short-subunit alcohol dehydrogenase family)